MTAATLSPPRAGTAPARTGRRALAAAAVAAAVALAAALTASLLSAPERVTPRFADGTVVTSDWGSPDLFGVTGSHILGYEHDTTVTFRVPWDGGPVVAARLGEERVHLLTVVDVTQQPGELVVTVERGNCRFFHERAIDMFAGLDVTLANGATTHVLFDRPLFVKSPMLAACPDRTIDRQDDVRAEV